LWKNDAAHSDKEHPIEIGYYYNRVDEKETTVVDQIEAAYDLTDIEVVVCQILIDGYEESGLEVGKKQA
jgi:hypothetical protein